LARHGRGDLEGAGIPEVPAGSECLEVTPASGDLHGAVDGVPGGPRGVQLGLRGEELGAGAKRIVRRVILDGISTRGVGTSGTPRCGPRARRPRAAR
ncbi:MAG TPA: hypothetical protein VKP69_14435, partial [Isosphaeraceae bacterium]|nr:hypothetical protein [Isosphaeraceae bacterium]